MAREDKRLKTGPFPLGSFLLPISLGRLKDVLIIRCQGCFCQLANYTKNKPQPPYFAEKCTASTISGHCSAELLQTSAPGFNRVGRLRDGPADDDTVAAEQL